MARASGGESALQKHLRVLEAFDAFRPYLTLSEIADSAGLAASTAHRLVAQLEAEGLLERLPDRSYRLGVRLWEFAARTPSALGLRELARPWMNSLHARIRQHTQLGVRSGRDVLFIERMSTPDAVVNATLIGGRTPLPVSSSGHVLLAYADDEVIDDVIAVGWPRFTAHTTRDGERLREALRRARGQGFADLPGHIHEDSRGVAVPVLGPQGAVHAALGIVVRNDGAAVQPLVELLTVAARGIGRALQQAYLPAEDERGRPHVSPLVSGSRASLDYFAGHDDPAAVQP